MPELQPTAVPTPPKVLTRETIAGLQIASPSEFDFINMLIYGEPGVGKTRLAGSSVLVPDLCPVLLMDFEGGTMSLAGDMREVDVVRLTSWAAVDRLYGSLYDKNPYKTVVVDSLSELQKFCMQEIMKEVVKKDSDRDPDIASMREWGKNGEQMRRFVRAFRDLQCNTIFTALAREERDERTNTIRTRPGLPGQMKGEVAGYVDAVLYMYKKEVMQAGVREIKTLVLTQGTERQVAKDRSGQLPALMESPTMLDIYTAMRGM
jgi:hypothetical protein